MALEIIDQLLQEREIEEAWELFHENSKLRRLERHTRFALPPSEAAIVHTMQELRRVKPYRDCPKVAIPMQLPASTRSIEEIMIQRESARSFSAKPLYLEELSKILYMAYGKNRANIDTEYPRPFRMVPSGGALYPLEIYICAERVEGLEAGIYHFDPEDLSLDVLRLGPQLQAWSDCFMQSDLATSAAALILVSAIFVRSTFKYADRGYRFVLLEAGHLAQNAILTAEGLDLAAVPVGGFIDCEVDRRLGLDGLNESVIYSLLLGRPGPVST